MTGQSLSQQNWPEGTGTFAYNLHTVISTLELSRHFCLSLFQLSHLFSFSETHFWKLFFSLFFLSEIPATSLSCPLPHSLYPVFLSFWSQPVAFKRLATERQERWRVRAHVTGLGWYQQQMSLTR